MNNEQTNEIILHIAFFVFLGSILVTKTKPFSMKVTQTLGNISEKPIFSWNS